MAKPGSKLLQKIFLESLQGKVWTPSGMKRRQELIIAALQDLVVYGRAVMSPHPESMGNPVVFELTPREWLDLVKYLIEIQQQQAFSAEQAEQNVVWILADDIPKLPSTSE
jgi:hypothetical protein